MVLQVRVHSARVTEREGIKLLLEPSSPDRLPRLSHLWLQTRATPAKRRAPAGSRGRVRVDGRDRVRHPPKPAPEEVMMRWAREWAEEGVSMDPKKLLPAERVPEAVLAEEVGGGSYLLLVGTQNRRMSLWTTSGFRRAQKSLHLRSDEPPDGEELARA